MCSFLFSTKKDVDVEKLNYYLKFRGPDYTNVQTINQHLYVHNLLSITGELTHQPFLKEDIVVLFNGEIYNYKEFGNYKTDGECIIDLYKINGPSFPSFLDGEFAICLIDYKQKIIVCSSDTFKTKPLFFGVSENNFACSTYKTPLEQLNFDQVVSCKPNTTYVFNLNTFELLKTQSVTYFDLNQHKSTYEDWVISFKSAVQKRTQTNKNIFIGLSSGYDSGAIYNELLANKRSFFSYTLTGTENDEIINKRLQLDTESICKSKLIPKTDMDFNLSHLFIKKRTEPFTYTIKSDIGDYNEANKLLIHDEGSNNLATICKLAKRDGCKICLSGSGADEIISDYGYNGTRYFPHSNFGGLFPDDLAPIFPWGSFFNSTMESYLAKEEYVGGSYGIEMRYPFLDKQLVQEFLWLSANFKNNAYKAPLDFYFKQTEFPYEPNQKRGF
jgi:asparagine synthase (glutamine-hydrolysing)